MKLKLAASLLLAALHIAPSSAFAPSSRVAIPSSSLRSYNNQYYDNNDDQAYSEEEYYNYRKQQQDRLYDEPSVDFSRRDTTGAFFRGLTAAGAVAAGSAVVGGRPWRANAAEFSEGVIPKSSAPVASAPAAGAPAKAQQAAAPAAKSPSFKFTPLKSPAQTARASASTFQYKNSLAELDSNVLAAGAVATAGIFGAAATLNSQEDNKNWSADSINNAATTKPSAPAATSTVSTAPAPPKKEVEKPWYQPPTPYGIVNKDKNPFMSQSSAPIPSVVAGAPPPLGAAPYGLAGGRNYWDNKVLQTAASLPSPPKKKVVIPPAPAIDSSKDNEKPWYQPPTPYGLVNKSNNPFLKDIQQYCEPGKVSQDCTESIKGYLNDLSSSGETASGEAAGSIVGYLDSLGRTNGNAAPSTEDLKQALVTSSAVPAASAEVVKEYLDALNFAKKPINTGMVMNAPSPSSAAKPPLGGGYEAYDERLSNIETRVDNLEQRVDAIPDEVFDRMEEWRTAQENRWVGQFDSVTNSAGGSTVGSGYSIPPPSSPPKKLKVAVRNAPRSTGLGGYLESLNP